MFNNIFFTIFSQLSMAILNVLLMIISSKLYGAEGRGYYSWWVLNFALVMHISGFVGGSALAYYSPRKSLHKIFKMVYAWALVSSFLMAFFFYVIGKLETQDIVHFVLLGFFDVLLGNHLFHLQGKQELKVFNIIQVLSILLLCCSIYIFYVLGFEMRKTMLFAFYVSKVCSLLGIYIFQGNSEKRSTELGLKDMLKFSSLIQLGGLIQFVNYRFTAYYLEHYYQNDLVYLGVFSAAISVAEGLWLVNRSISIVHYAQVTNSENMSHNIQNTVRLVKYTFWIMLCFITLFLFIPNSLYVFFLGSDFMQVKTLITILSPGILIFSVSGIMSHFYSGIGVNSINVYASSVGAVFAIIGGLILIPLFGVSGAALTNVFSYAANVFILLFFLHKKYAVPVHELIPRISDAQDIIRQVKQKYQLLNK